MHEWRLLEIAEQLDQVRGEHLNWDSVNITEPAWARLIHQGIKPVVAFAHPQVLQRVVGATGYYRMLAMVSQKSMKRLGLSLDRYEVGDAVPDKATAGAIAMHLNRIISALIEADETIDAREFDLWRGMAAGSQAQGSWQNNKGAAAEVAIREVILRRLQARENLAATNAESRAIDLGDGRTLIFADEPDIAIYRDGMVQVAIEIKGGIDRAGVLERIGAALKSLQRTRQDNPDAVNILILQAVSMTERAEVDLRLSIGTINHLFSLTALVEDEAEREKLFAALEI